MSTVGDEEKITSTCISAHEGLRALSCVAREAAQSASSGCPGLLDEKVQGTATSTGGARSKLDGT